MTTNLRFGSALRRLGLLTAAVAVAAALGCSGSTVKKTTVSGTVSYKGERLHSGYLRVTGPDGSFSTAPIKADGTFTLTDVVPGDVKVGIQEEPQGAVSPDAQKHGATAPAKRVPLPAYVRDPEKSGLKYNITSDTRELTIEIK